MTDASERADLARPTVRKFNPGTLQDDAEIVAQFSVRRAEFNVLLDVVRSNLGRTSCQHALIVAPRGRGKTMLLARAAAELRTDPELAAALLPVRFMEESHEIADIADFWLEALFHLAREIAATRPELAAELRTSHASLCDRWRERELGDLASAAVLDAADRLGRRLVLMIENLQALCGSAGVDFGWQLRKILQTEPRVILLASATSRFDGLDDADEPFFELFRIVDLKPLGTDECRRLWAAAGGEPRSGRDVRPLEILTGGNPRLLVIVAGFSRYRSLRQLMEELVALVDDHTEYFRGHLEVLPNVERRVYVAVIDLWRPSTTGEIAARARVDIRTASTMIGRLSDRGAVTRTGEGRKRFYAAAEPLYSIYYKLRRERDEAAVVESLIVFMMGFYDRTALGELFGQFLVEARESRTLHRGIERALARRPEDADPATRMTWDWLADVSMKVGNHHWSEAQISLQKDVEASFREGEPARVIELIDRYVAEGWTGVPLARQDHDTAYLGHLRAEAYLRMGEFEKVAEIGRDLQRRFRASRDLFVLWRAAIVLLRRTEAHAGAGDPAGAAASARELVSWFGQWAGDAQFGPLVAGALVRQAEAESDMGRFDAADALLEEVVARFGHSESPAFHAPVVAAMVRKADVARSVGRDAAAVATLYDRAIERGRRADVDGVARALSLAYLNRAFVLAELDDFEGEIASFGEFIDMYGDNEAFAEQVDLALAYRTLREAELGAAERAMHGCAQLDRRLRGPTTVWASWIRGVMLGARATSAIVAGDVDAALEEFRLALEAFPAANELSMRTLTRLTLNLVALGAPESNLLDALSRDGDTAATVAPLIAALRERLGERVRVPEEIRSVAADVCKQMEERSDEGRLTAF